MVPVEAVWSVIHALDHIDGGDLRICTDSENGLGLSCWPEIVFSTGLSASSTRIDGYLDMRSVTSLTYGARAYFSPATCRRLRGWTQGMRHKMESVVLLDWRSRRLLACALVALRAETCGRSAQPLGGLVRYVGSFLAAASILVTTITDAKYASTSTRERFSESETIVLVTIESARDSLVPWPYGFSKDALPGKLLTLRVVRSGKGSLRPGDVAYGWAWSRRVEDTYTNTDVGAKMLVFLAGRDDRYSAAELSTLIEAANRVTRRKSGPALTVLRLVA
jgi:hypothetical protein